MLAAYASPFCVCSAVATASVCFFFFIDTATTEIYTLSLHDALPIYGGGGAACRNRQCAGGASFPGREKRRRADCTREIEDRKSTRLNSSHQIISYAVFCLKKKKLE